MNAALSFEEKAQRIRGVMFDIDGCLILSDGPGGFGGKPLPGAIEAVNKVRQSGLPFVIFTNGSMQTPEQIGAELRKNGFDVRDEEVFTPAVVAAQIMKARYPEEPILVFGGEGVKSPFRKLGLNTMVPEEQFDGLKEQPVGVVIGWDTEFGLHKAQIAAEAIIAGAKLFCTSFASFFASKTRLNVGISGFITAGLMHVTGCEVEVLGKPSQSAIDAICLAMGVQPDELLIIGDDLPAEARMAIRAGGVGCIVTTGTATREMAENAPDEMAPDVIVDSMHEFMGIFDPYLSVREEIGSQ